jgi:hypothetical protein
LPSTLATRSVSDAQDVCKLKIAKIGIGSGHVFITMPMRLSDD